MDDVPRAGQVVRAGRGQVGCGGVTGGKVVVAFYGVSLDRGFDGAGGGGVPGAAAVSPGPARSTVAGSSEALSRSTSGASSWMVDVVSLVVMGQSTRSRASTAVLKRKSRPKV